MIIMPTRVSVPKFITIEDKLAGLLTFRQLFALLGAFILTFFIFKINQLLGIIVGIIFFGLAILFTFVYINGKPFVQILPNIMEFLFQGRKFVWKKLEKTVYKKVEIKEVEEIEPSPPLIKERDKQSDILPLEISYPEIAPEIKDKVIISLNQPIANQIDEITKIIHRHLVNPKNPYRLFPYVKFYRTFKK